MSLIPTYPAALLYEASFNTGPLSATVPPYWTDLSARTVVAWSTARGRQYELDTNPAGQWNAGLDNRDGALDPSNTSSPFYPNVVPYRGARIRVRLGVNALTVDQATAGQGTHLPPGTSGQALSSLLGVGNDSGYTVSLASSGSAYTGSQVYQVTLPSGATAGATVLLLSPVPVVPGQWYSATAQVVIPSGSSVSTQATITYYNTSGTAVGSATGSAQTVTSGSSSWTALTVSGQAPTGSSAAYYAAVKVQVASGTLDATTTFQVGALQVEQSQTATPWQAPQTLPANLFPRVIATGSASMSAADSVFNWWYATGSGQGLTQGQFLTAAPSGQTVAVGWVSAAGTTSANALYFGNWLKQGTSGPQPDNVQVTAGQTYTASWYSTRLSSADTTVQVTARITWYTAAGSTISTTSGTAVTVPVTPSWVRLSVSGAAPAGAVWGRTSAVITTPSPTTASNTVYIAGAQFEQAASASTWMDPGQTGYIFTGFFERYPQTWLMNGTYGQVGAIGVDAEAVIAQDTLLAPFVEEVLALNPNFLYQLNDPAGASSCVDSTGNRPPAPIEAGPFGPGSLTLGSSITSATAAGGFQGTAGPVATFNNNPSNSPPFQIAETFVSLHKTTVSPGPPSSGAWTRVIAFRSTTAPGTGNLYAMWFALPGSFNSANLSSFVMGITDAGQGYMINSDVAQAYHLSYTGTTNLCDGDWHLMAIGVSPGSATKFWVDDTVVASLPGGANPSSFASDILGCAAYFGSNIYGDGFVGDLAFAIEFPFLTSSAQMANLYNSWRTASAGESSGARVQRVLSWIGFQGATAIDTGSTSNMGPANDLTGATGLDALNAIALTENGNLFVSNGGALTFTARSRRYNGFTPACIFGENAASGEWPYESVAFDYDPTHLFNDIQVTQYSTSQVAESIDAASQAAYLQRVLQRTTNQGSFTETVDAANYLLQQYKSPRMRVSDLTLHPAAVPGLWAVCMALEIGTRIRIMRRPPSAPAIAVDCFTESITWDVDPDTGDAVVHIQCSPADLAAYWTLGSLRTTLASQAANSQNVAIINALPDSAVNALASSLPSSGYQLVFDPGTSIQETMTIAAGSVPTTIIGYTTASLTFTTNFRHTHAAGSVVCEVLPTAITDPTTYDQASILAPVATTLNAAAASGTNTITVNALPDGKTNSAGSDWTTGDLVWISPGTPQFEGYNLLTPNQSTAGQGVLPLAVGTPGWTIGVTGDNGTPTVTASGSAYQGSNVWQAAVAANAATPSGLLYVLKVNATAGLPFTASAYVRSVTTGANPQVVIYIKYLSASSGSLTQWNGVTTTLTGSPSASWTRLTVTGTASAGTVWAQIGVVLTGTAPSAAWTWQGDGLQLEQASTASAYQTCPQISSVGPSVEGYSTVTITLAQNLTANHAAGDYVCDPLPPGTTSPAAAGGTTRVAY